MAISGNGLNQLESSQTSQQAPKLYTAKQFDENAYRNQLLLKQYGEKASRWDRFKFKRYMNSDEGLQALQAAKAQHNESERQKANPQPAMRSSLGGDYTPEYEAWDKKYKEAKQTGFKKQGGTMNRINYFQQGGAAPLQDMQQQIIQLVQAAMSGDQKATKTINQIMDAAKAGDQLAALIAQMIQTVAQQMQGLQAPSAKWGSKLKYIRSLKYARGGVVCPSCQSGAQIPNSQDKAYLKSTKKVEEKACGGKAKKTKKRYFGGWL